MLIPKRCYTTEDMEMFIRAFSEYAEDFYIVEGSPRLVVIKIPEEFKEEAKEIWVKMQLEG